MSVPVLIEVYEETRRLAIAGSAVAPGDFRLKKLAPPLEKAGERAPVFGKVAQSVKAVVESDDKTASAALLDLATLVNAILYTQGETGLAGELQPIETTDLGQHETQSSARLLKPLIEALATAGSGRLEVVRDAFERGMFRDLRLVQPSLKALDDSFPDIADFIAESVLPLYGKAILPELRSRFDVKGKGGNVRRLQVMHRLDPQGTRELVKQALDEGSKEMRIAAVACLGSDTDDVTYLLTQAKAKAKDVRAAALGALARVGSVSAEALTILKAAIAGADLGLIVASIQKSPSKEVHAFVVQQVDEQLSGLRKMKDKAKQGEAIVRLKQLLLCVAERTEAEAILLRCFDESAALAKIKSEPSGGDLNELVASLMANATAKTRERLVAAHESLTGLSFSSALDAARVSLSPAEFFDRFASVLKPPSKRLKVLKGVATDPERSAALVQVLTSAQHFAFTPSMDGRVYRRVHTRSTDLPELDPRWLEVALAVEQADLIRELARPNDPATNRFLSRHFVELTEKAKGHEPHALLELAADVETMVRIHHPEATDILIDWLKQQASATHSYYTAWVARLIPDLPASAAAQIEAILPSLPEKMVDQLMDPLLTLKNKEA